MHLGFQFKKDGGKADQNESNSSGASRGNWWQGRDFFPF